MATVAELMVNISADIRNFSAGIQQTTQGFNNIKNYASASTKVLKTGLIAAGAAMASVGAAASVTGKKVYDSVKNVAAAGDEIDKMSQKLGLSTDAYQEWGFVLSQSGLDIDNLQSGMKTLTNSVDDAITGGKKSNEVFKQLNISVNDLKTSSREEIFAKTIQSLQGVQDETKKAALANDLFGRSGQDLLPLLNQTDKSTQELINTAKQMGFVLGEDAVSNAVKFTDTMDKLKTTFAGVKNNIMSQLLPGFTSVADGFTDLIMGVSGADKKILDGVDKIANSFKTMIPKFLNVLVVIVKAIAEMAPTIIITLVNGILSELDSLLNTAYVLIGSLVKGLINSIPQLTNAALQILLFITNSILDNLPELLNAAIEIIITLADGIAKALPDLIPTIVDTILLIVDTLINNLDKLIKAALEIIKAIAKGLIKALPILLKKAPVIMNALTNAIINNLPIIIDAAVEIIIALSLAIIDNLPLIILAGFKIIKGLFKGMAKINVYNEFNGIFNKMLNYLSKLPAILYKKGKAMGGNLWSGFKKSLGINSPSYIEEAFFKMADSANFALKDIKAQIPKFEMATNGIGNITAGRESSQNQNSYISNFNIENVNVRNQTDIEKISQQLYRLMQSRSRAQGGRL